MEAKMAKEATVLNKSFNRNLAVIGATLVVMLVAMVSTALMWHGRTNPGADCSGWTVSVDTNWEGHEGVIHSSTNLEGAWSDGQQSVDWYVKIRWYRDDGSIIDSWEDSGTIARPDCSTPEPPTSTPEPTNTPVPTQHTPEPSVEQPKDWWACDDTAAPAEFHAANCQPAEAEEVVAQTVATPEPICTDCGTEARFELLDNAVVFGGLEPGDNRGTFYTRGEGIPTSENVSLVFENRGLKVYRWTGETPNAGIEEHPCSAEPQIEQFDLVDGVILYRILPQNSRWDLQTVFENIDGASLDEGQMIAAWYEFSRTSDANFGFRPVGTYTPGMEDQVWSQLGKVFGIRIEAQIAHDMENVFDYTALQIATAAIREYTLKGIETIISTVAQKGIQRGVQILSHADLTQAAAKLSAPANTTSGTSLAFALPFVLVLGGLGFEANRRRKGNAERDAA